jgi:serine/threonine protein kinase
MAEDFIGKELLGQFRVLERIGRGGMGEVYKAEQPAMDRMVAIKILHAKLAQRPDLVSRFRREARAMSRLSHPNSVRVFLYGHFEDTDQLYIVMEYLAGIDLARLVRRDGPVEINRAIRIMIQVLGALEEAHSVGVIHRDLKPENILLTEQGGIRDFPKVLDFGLAKIRETKPRPGSLVLTREGMVFGTPEFMSPEQARGETLDARSDIYSVSLIFYELVTGQLPFPKSKPMEYISHHINTPPTPISARDPNLGLPKALDPIIARALEKDRNKRYSSAKEFAEALRALLPRSEQTALNRALPQPLPQSASSAETQPLPKQQRISKSPSTGDSRPTRSANVGKGLLIALIAVILVLAAIVLFLLFNRKEPPPASIPINAPFSVQPQPGTNTARPAPGAQVR